MHSIVAEPDGPGTGGTIKDMVSGLWEERYSEYEDWEKQWLSEAV